MGKKSAQRAFNAAVAAAVAAQGGSSPVRRPLLARGAILIGLIGVLGASFGAYQAYLNYRRSLKPDLREVCPRRWTLETGPSLHGEDRILELVVMKFWVENQGEVTGFLDHATMLDVEATGRTTDGIYIDRTLIAPGEIVQRELRFWLSISNARALERRKSNVRVSIFDNRGEPLRHAKRGDPFEPDYNSANVVIGDAEAAAGGYKSRVGGLDVEVVTPAPPP